MGRLSEEENKRIFTSFKTCNCLQNRQQFGEIDCLFGFKMDINGYGVSGKLL